MGFIQEFRTSLENPSTPLSFPAEWLLDIFNGGRTDSGVRVSEMTALQVTTVWACVNLIASALGFLDLEVIEKTVSDKGRVSRRIAHDHALFDLLEHTPNPEMSAFTLRKTAQAHALLWGNLYIELQRDKSSRIVAMWPRNPARIRPHRASEQFMVTTSDGIRQIVPAGGMVYLTTEGMETAAIDPESPDYNHDGPSRAILPEDMIHVPGLALDGRIGQSTIQMARQAVGLSLATEKFGAKFFGNGARPLGVLSIPNTMTPEAREVLKRSWSEAQGGENANRPAVLENGLVWKETATKPNEGQFVETREHQISECCRIFGVPPHMIGETGKQNRANTEQIGLEFVTFVLQPWLKAWQQEIKRKMFQPATVGRGAGKNFGAMFNTRPLTMPDAESRRNFYASGKQWGYLSTNMILDNEGINPVDDPSADAFWMPINMQDMAKAYEEPAQGPGPADGAGDDPAADDKKKGAQGKEAKRIVGAYSRLFRDAFDRICARDKVDSKALERTFLPVFTCIGEVIERSATEQFSVEFEEQSPWSASDGVRFLGGYFETMSTRVSAWKSANGSAGQVSDRELMRAVRAIAIEVYRSVATRIAKTKIPAEVTE